MKGLTALLRFLFNIFFQFKLGEELDFRFSLLNIGQIFIYLFFPSHFAPLHLHITRVKCVILHLVDYGVGFLLLVLYLENDDFAIISLEVKSPCGSDEAMGLTHYIIPETSDQSQRVQKVNPRHHALQLGENKQTNKQNILNK